MIDWMNPSEEMLAGLQAGRDEAAETMDAHCESCKDDMEAAWLEREAILQAKHAEEMAAAVWLIERLASGIIKARDCIIQNGDIDDVYHELYLAADPGVESLEPWNKLEALAAHKETKEEPKDGEVCEWDEKPGSRTNYNEADYFAKAHSLYFYSAHVGQYPYCPRCGKPIRLAKDAEDQEGRDD